MINRSRRIRLAALLLIGSVVIGGAAFYIECYIRRPIGEGPAGPRVNRVPFEAFWTRQRIQMIGVGDSVTAGLGARDASHTFFNRIWRNPEDEYAEMDGICLSVVLPNLKTENFAVSGTESIAHLDTIEQRIPTYPDKVFGLVLMTSGGNDLIHHYGRRPPRECAMYGATLEEAEPWIAGFAVRLEKMLAAIDEKFPGGCEIYIGDIYDPTDGSGDAPSVYLPEWNDGLEIHARYNTVIVDVAASRSNAFVVPLRDTFLGHGARCRQFWRAKYDSDDPHFWYYSNIEDPNDRGYDAIRRIFLKAILQHSRLRS